MRGKVTVLLEWERPNQCAVGVHYGRDCDTATMGGPKQRWHCGFSQNGRQKCRAKVKYINSFQIKEKKTSTLFKVEPILIPPCALKPRGAGGGPGSQQRLCADSWIAACDWTAQGYIRTSSRKPGDERYLHVRFTLGLFISMIIIVCKAEG